MVTPVPRCRLRKGLRSFRLDHRCQARCPVRRRRCDPTHMEPPPEPLATLPTYYPHFRCQQGHTIWPHRFPTTYQQSVEIESSQPSQTPPPPHQVRDICPNTSPAPLWEPISWRFRTTCPNSPNSQFQSANFFQIPDEQRQKILDAFIKWETNRIQAGLTGLDSNLHDILHSDTNDTFLKQFWTIIVLPSLHHHFICRNPDCKKVVMSHHWATSVKHGARKQGHYLCPSCLAIYRPFSDIDHKGNPLLKPKQCLVVKAQGPIHNLDMRAAQTLAHDDRPEIHYYLYLMEWPEETTDKLFNDLKIHTAELFKAYDSAEDRIQFLHDAIRDQLRQAQRLPYMTRTAWPEDHLRELEYRNQQANFELYRIQDLPTFGPADKKIPFYDWCHYKYTEGETQVLSPQQVTKIMALTFCRMMVASHTKELLHQAKRQRTSARSSTEWIIEMAHTDVSWTWGLVPVTLPHQKIICRQLPFHNLFFKNGTSEA